MPRFKRILGSVGLSLQTLCVFALAIGQPVRGEEAGLAAQISQSEILMFGQPKIGLPAVERVQALETDIFGEPSSGPLNLRLKKINEALGMSGTKGIEPNPGEHKSAVVPESKKSSRATEESALPPQAPKVVMSTKQLLQLGAKRFAEGDYAASKELFRKVLVEDPKNVDALYNLGALAERRGDPGSALNLYRAAFALKPTDTELKQAVESIEQQLASGNASSADRDRNGPFHMPQRLGQPLTGGVFDNQLLSAQSFSGTAMQPTVGQQPVVGASIGQGQVTQPPFGLANVTQPSIGMGTVTQPNHGKSAMKHVIKTGLNVGLSIPGSPLSSLHCPLCGLLSHW